MLESVQRARKTSTRKRALFLLSLLTIVGTLFILYFASDGLSAPFLSISSARLWGHLRNSNLKTNPSPFSLQETQHDSPPSNILLVSGFFPSPTSKHTQAEYNKSLSQFLSQITTDVYVFTSLEFEDQVRAIRGDLPIWVDTTFETPLDIPPLVDFQDRYRNMRRMRGSKSTGSPHLYAMRTSKIYFLKQALYELQGQSSPAHWKYRYAFWIDFDSFPADHTFKHWPDPFRVEKVWNDGAELNQRAEEDLIFMPIKGLPNPSMSMWSEDMGPIDNQFSQSTFFGGMPSAIGWLHDAYFAYHNRWLQNGRFVGKDDAIFNAIFLLHPSRIMGVWLFDPISNRALAILSSLQFSSFSPERPPPKEMLLTPLGECREYSAYPIFFLGRETERNEMARSWLNRWRWMWPWQWIRQAMIKRQTCSLTQVLSMSSTLTSRAFNAGWSPPSSDIYPEEE